MNDSLMDFFKNGSLNKIIYLMKNEDLIKKKYIPSELIGNYF